MDTLYMRITSFDIRSYRLFLCLPLHPDHRVARVEWCRERQHWTHEWNNTVFSDDLMSLGTDCGPMMVVEQ
jgi:hypothetical protein